MKYKVIVLFDRLVPGHFLYEGLKRRHTKTLFIDNEKDDASMCSWLKGAFRAVRHSRNSDVIVCWSDIQAVLCWWISLLLFRRCRIIAINILLKDKNSFKNRCVSIMYKYALRSGRTEATVSSESFAQMLNRKLKIDKSYTIMKDVYKYAEIESPFADKGRKVFVGGSNGRDWEAAFRVAATMPDVEFSFVHTGSARYSPDAVSPNIRLYNNIPVEEFIDIQRRCSITYLPLLTEAPAGLIVMYQAAALNQLVIMSDTITTREYITEERGCLVPMYDSDKAVERIRYYLENINERELKSRTLKAYLRENCSESAYVDTINRLIFKLLDINESDLQ